MDNGRLTKQVFNFDFNTCANNWSSDVKHIFSTLGINGQFESKTLVDLKVTNGIITQHYRDKWSHDVTNMPKLRTYKIFKTDFNCEDYMTMNLSKYERSLLCQFRTGILPLRIDTGRYVWEPVERRTCRFCDIEATEDERHFLLACNLYNDIRTNVFRV